jgi:WD40 repeat protein
LSLIVCLTVVATMPAAPAEVPRTDRLGDPLPPRAIARLGTHRLTNGSAMALAPDASAIAVLQAFRDEVVVSELPSGKPLWTAALRSSGGSCINNDVIRFSPDGKTLALSHITSPDTGDVHVWEARTGRLLHRFASDGGGPLAFSPKGRRLAYAHHEAVDIRDLESGKCLSTWKVEEWASPLAWSVDGRTLLVCDHPPVDRKVRNRLSERDALTGKELRSWLPYREGTPWTTTLSPDGKHFALQVNEASLRVQDTASGREAFRTPAGARFRSLPVFSGDGRRLVGVAEGVLHVWDTSTWKLLQSVAVQPSYVYSLVLSADGGTAAFCSELDNKVHVWDLAKKRPLCEFPGHRGVPVQVAFSADGREVVTMAWHCFRDEENAIRSTWSLRRWDAETGAQTRRLEKDIGEVDEVVLSGDGQRAGFALASATLALWDVEREREVRRWPLPRREHPEPIMRLATVTSFTFSSDGREMLATGGGKLHRWDTASGKELPGYTVPGTLDVYLPRGRLQYDGSLPVKSYGPDWRLRLLDTKSGRLGRRFPIAHFGAQDIALSADGRTLAALQEGRVQLWEVATRESRGEVPGAETGVGIVVFSPDCRLLAVPAKDHETILLWDLRAGKVRARLKGRGGVEILAFSPDSRRLVSGGGVPYVWDVTDSTPEARLDDKQLEGLWRDLHSPGGAAAYRAIWHLAGDPAQSVSFLRQRLLTASTHGARMARLIDQLSDDSFKVREAASTELARFGTLAVPALVAAKKGKLSPEGQRRINELLAKLPPGTPPSAALIGSRVIEALERAGTAEARKMMEEIGKQEMWRDEVQSTLRRMGKTAQAFGE